MYIDLVSVTTKYDRKTSTLFNSFKTIWIMHERPLICSRFFSSGGERRHNNSVKSFIYREQCTEKSIMKWIKSATCATCHWHLFDSWHELISSCAYLWLWPQQKEKEKLQTTAGARASRARAPLAFSFTRSVSFLPSRPQWINWIW